MASTGTSPPYDDIAWRIYVGIITTIVPATIVVILRYIARYVARAGLWWDDYTIVAALVSTQAFSILQKDMKMLRVVSEWIINWALAAVRWVQIAEYGLGQHDAHLLPDQISSLGEVWTES